MDVDFFDRNHYSELNNKYSCLEEIPSFISQFIELATHSIYLIFIAVTFVYACPCAGIPFVAMLIVQGMLEHSLDTAIEERALRAELAREPCHLLREEAFANARTIKECSCENKQARHFAALLADVQEARRRYSQLTSLRSGMCNVFWAVSMTIPSYVVIWRILRGAGTAADLNTVTTYVFWFKLSLAGFFSGLAKLTAKLARLSRVVALMDCAAAAAAAPRGAAQDKAGMRGEVRLHAVDFAYPSRPDRPVLRGVTLTLEAGKTTALCGGSGGGKSSIAGLVLRNYDPQAPPPPLSLTHTHTHTHTRIADTPQLRP
jgi:ABC-type multidrug transport system fused ATPase/permease subunit